MRFFRCQSPTPVHRRWSLQRRNRCRSDPVPHLPAGSQPIVFRRVPVAPGFRRHRARVPVRTFGRPRNAELRQCHSPRAACGVPNVLPAHTGNRNRAAWKHKLHRCERPGQPDSGSARPRQWKCPQGSFVCVASMEKVERLPSQPVPVRQPLPASLSAACQS